MRAVSFFGSTEGGIRGGRTADNGRGAAGGFGCEKFVDENLRGQTAVKRDRRIAGFANRQLDPDGLARGYTLGSGGCRRR